uniref:C-type lectin domain-containing protein n=1 Tax=Kryptolebias marmoratus TaxID=37003 RepID=A0A3Q3BMF3_KRYMA
LFQVNPSANKKNALLSSGFFATFDSFSYFFYSDVVTRQTAVNYCMKHHRNLLQNDASFNRSKVYAQSTSWFMDYSQAWIGVYMTATVRYWVSGGAVTYTNWSSGEPNGQPDNLYGNEFCAAMVLEDGTWADEPCDKLYPFICFDGLYNKHFSHI